MASKSNRIVRNVGLPATVTLLFFGLLFVSGCELLDPNPGPEPYGERDRRFDTENPIVPPVDTVPPSASRGVELYAQYCARCHGDDANGTSLFDGSIRGKKGLHLIVREGRGGMPAFPGLSDNEIESIERYLDSIATPLDSATGEELFRFYCAGCHGADGLGTNRFSGSIRGFSPITPIVVNGRGKMPAIDIEQEQIRLIQQYLLEQTEDLSIVDGVTYFSRVCAGCHGSEGEGTYRAPEIRNVNDGFARYIIRNGRTSHALFEDDMPRYSGEDLSDRQLGEIIAWLRSAPNPTYGQDLYNRYCSNCHAVDGSGGPADKKIFDEDLDEYIETVREGKGGRDYGDRDDYMPSWSRSELSDAEIRAIHDWIAR